MTERTATLSDKFIDFESNNVSILYQSAIILQKKVREKSRECHNHKPQPFPDIKTKRKQTKPNRKQTKPNKRKSNKRTKSTKISFHFPKWGNTIKDWKTQEQNNTR